MFYYSHHIGDFVKKTSNLDDHQLVTYLRLLWKYYSDEKPISGEVEDLAFVMRSDEKTVRLLLRHYFTETPDGWTNKRCDEEIQTFKDKSESASKSAKARWENAKAMQSKSERNANASKSDANERVLDANQEPITNNQEPNKKHKAPAIADAELFPGVDPQVVSDFKALRKEKKAAITPTAMRTIGLEAAKANMSLDDALRVCCARGWQGFKAEWVTQSGVSGRNQTSNNMHVNHLDHSSSKRAMEESMRKHGITEIPAGEIEF